MTARERALNSLTIGDIFHVEEETGPCRTCLVVEMTEMTIAARSITTQNLLKFDRRTGIAVHELHGSIYHWVIKSVAVLPSDIRKIVLGLDKKGAERAHRRATDPSYEAPPEELALTEDEKKALLFVGDFYRDNPI